MIIDCLSKAIFLFAIYNIVILMLFGIPESLSATYYLFKERNDHMKVLFPAMIIMLGIFLMPCWIQISEGSNFQFLSFLSTASLIFVGVEPAFNKGKLENKIHMYSAYCCTAFAILWIVLVTPYWYIIPIVSVIIGIAGWLTKSWKNGYAYWIELIVFISTFISILAYYLNTI
jgi:hypothetical protein